MSLSGSSEIQNTTSSCVSYSRVTTLQTLLEVFPVEKEDQLCARRYSSRVEVGHWREKHVSRRPTRPDAYTTVSPCLSRPTTTTYGPNPFTSSNKVLCVMGRHCSWNQDDTGDGLITYSKSGAEPRTAIVLWQGLDSCKVLVEKEDMLHYRTVDPLGS